MTQIQGNQLANAFAGNTAFTDIKNAMVPHGGKSDGKHIRFEATKGLYTSQKGSLSGLKSAFGGDQLQLRAQKQAAGAARIKSALDNQYGLGTGAAVFNHLQAQFGRDLNQGVKRKDLDRIEHALLHGNQALAAKLPTGATVDVHGNAGGQQTITHIPQDAGRMRPDLGGVAGTEVGAGLSAMSAGKLAQQQGATGKQGLGQIGNLPVFRQAASDFYRFDYAIPTGGGHVFRSSADPAPDQDTRNANVAGALRAFAGSDEAATALSAVVVQDTLAAVSGMMSGQDGSHLLLDRPQFQRDADDGGAMHGHMRQPDGTSQPLEIKDMGAASWQLSKTPDGDFKISVDWPRPFVGIRTQGGTEALPLDQGHVLEARMRFDIIVDAEAAHAGRVSLSVPNGIDVSYRGGLAT